MTCIVGIRHGERVTLGGDSLTMFHGNAVRVRATPKVYVKHELAFGFTGLCRVADVIQHELDLPRLSDALDSRWLVTRLIQPLRSTLSAQGARHTENGEETYPGEILVGGRGQLYMIDAAFAVHAVASDYFAVGAGADVALGALYALEDEMALPSGDREAEQRARIALGAAQAYGPWVREPFHFVTV